jgi:hypothetical protein
MNANTRAISGGMTASDYDVLTGGSLSANQNLYDALDNGTLNTKSSGGKTTSTYTPPAWLRATMKTSAGTQRTAATSNAPLINGMPASGPAEAGQPQRGNRR